MVAIDGGAGGGQVLRTALTLSVIESEPLEMSGIRGDRSDPGLNPQHLAAVEAAARVSDATVEGADLGSTEIVFDPGDLQGGQYWVEIGSAGSLTLLFDVFLPLGVALDEPLVLAATGGTDVKWSPPMAVHRQVKLPLLLEHGVAAAIEHHRTGFYPAGGGRATLHLWPSRSVAPFDLGGASTIGEPAVRVISKASTDLAGADVAERQAAQTVTALQAMDFDVGRKEVIYAEAASPGSMIAVVLDGPGLAAAFDAYGERGTPAKAVADAAVSDLRAFRETSAAVDAHLADQLLVFLALGGGRLAVPEFTDHVRTCLSVVETFGYDLVAHPDRSPPTVEAV